METYPFPSHQIITGLFWASPAAPGFYGMENAPVYWVTTNYAPALAKLGTELAGQTIGILALDAGGLPLNMAASLGMIPPSEIVEYLRMVEVPSQFMLPKLLAADFQIDQTIGIHTVNVVESSSVYMEGTPSGASSPEPAKLPNLLWMRLIGGLRLWIGQVVVFALPLFLFGLQALGAGMLALLIATCVLALLWKVLPGDELIKGAVGGAGLALLCGGWLVGTRTLPSLQIIFAVGGIWLAAVWMGFVFKGVHFSGNPVRTGNETFVNG